MAKKSQGSLGLAREVFAPDPNPITRVSRDFLEYFGSMEVVEEKILLHSRELGQPMNDQAIAKHCQPEPTTLGVVLYNIRYNKKLVRNGAANIFYVEDKDGVLRALGVYQFDDGWGVRTDSVEDPCSWAAGGRVFSRKFKRSGSKPK
ncbi:MAG: hypothetical protein AAB364_02645 [Patescibacteria group bacterium]